MNTWKLRDEVDVSVVIEKIQTGFLIKGLPKMQSRMNVGSPAVMGVGDAVEQAQCRGPWKQERTG